MLKLYVKKLLLGLAFLLTAQFAYAQTKVAGTITDGSTKEPLIGASVQVKGKVIGTITDSKGNFSLSTSTPVPFTLVISSVGYSLQEVSVSSDNTSINITLEEQSVLGQEIVVSASRVEEKVLRSPVAVEKLDLRAIRETPSANFYDAIANLKGVDMTTQGLLFKSFNMRGFGSTGNPRTVQMIDGMDNSAPGLNFPVDNIVGMPELDVESVEVLPGAASALYGPNAINGLVLMNSKSPFLYQGLSAAIKTGVMHADNRTTATTPFYDLSMRFAKAWNNKTAFKINLAYIGAKDWESNNYTNLNVGGAANPDRSVADTDYDGVNTYGDEARRVLTGIGAVSRTGFLEKDLVDYNTKSFKTNIALHHRLNDKVEAVAQVNYGYGTTIYTGTGKYSLRNFNLTQAKIELRGDNFTLRAYTTQERSGKSYTAGLVALSMQAAVKSDNQWFTDYTTEYNKSKDHMAARKFADTGMQTPGTAAFETALDKARDASIVKGGGGFLDKTNMYHAEGVYNFKNQIKFVELLVGANLRQYQLRSEATLFADTQEGRTGTINIPEYGGFAQLGKSLFKDHLKLTASMRYDKSKNFEGQFTPRLSAVVSVKDQNIRFSYQTGFRIPTTQNQYIDLATPLGILIGGLPEFDKRYGLQNGILRQNLVDFSANPTKYITADVLAKAQAYATAAVTAQLPLIQAGVTAAVTAQLPLIQAGVTQAVQAQVTAGVTAQVNAAVAAGLLPASQAAAAIAGGVTQTMALPSTQATIKTNVDATVASTIKSNVEATVKSEVTKATTQVVPAYALATLPKYQAKTLVPERIKSFEIGYKGLIGKKLFFDSYYYKSVYTNFIGGTVIVVSGGPAAPGLPAESGIGVGNLKGYSRPANTDQPITVKGWAFSLNYSLPKGFNIGANVANNKLTGFTPTPEQQYAGFNTPENRYTINFGKRLGSNDKYGFSIALRHQDAFTWQSSFVQPSDATQALFTNTEIPAINNLDAQVSFKLSKMKSVLKVGGTNLLGGTYYQAYGSASVGQMYYVALSFDGLLNK